MAYATIDDVQQRMLRGMDSDEQRLCGALLDDAAAMIDAVACGAPCSAKLVVSCRMVIRALGDGAPSGMPIGATQGSMSALGYSQSWTVSGGSTGELYFGKADRQLLGLGSKIGSRSPLEDMACTEYL